MCDYSLEHVNSRSAKVGDRLVTTNFSNTITRGFATVDDPTVVVCLLPGTELAFEEPIKYDHALFSFLMRRDPGEIIKNTSGTTAVFRQINIGNPHQHHDALELPSGNTVLLTRLIAGQKAVVLQLPVVQAVGDDEDVGDETPAEQPAEAPAQPTEQPVVEQVA